MKRNEQELLKNLELDPFPQPDVIPLRYPVLLCHGYGAIASLFKPAPLHDACMLLRRHGITAYASNVEPYARIEPRASNWKKLIRQILSQTGAPKLNIIAHSMGGLDIRYAISALDMEGEIATLTTLSTPHRGTVLADLALSTPTPLKSGIGAFFDWLGDYIYPEAESDSLGPLEQLTPHIMNREFNIRHPNSERVDYFSYTAAIGKGTDQDAGSMLRFQNRYIFEREGINDGFVSVESGKWGKHMQTFTLSHLEHMKLGLSGERIPLWEKCWLQMVRNLNKNGY